MLFVKEYLPQIHIFHIKYLLKPVESSTWTVSFYMPLVTDSGVNLRAPVLCFRADDRGLLPHCGRALFVGCRNESCSTRNTINRVAVGLQQCQSLQGKCFTRSELGECEVQNSNLFSDYYVQVCSLESQCPLFFFEISTIMYDVLCGDF